MRRALAIALVLAPILAAGCGHRSLWGGGLGSPPAPVSIRRRQFRKPLWNDWGLSSALHYI